MSCPAHALAASQKQFVREDIDLIRRLVFTLQEKKEGRLNVYDLGAGSGTSALSVLAEASRDSVRITTVDNDEQALSWAELAVSNIGRRADWRGVVADEADESSRKSPGEKVDLLLVNVEHTYAETKAVLTAWLPHLSDGGIVCVHNYDDPIKFGLPSKSILGVKQAVDEAVENGQLEEFAVSGLGWAGTKSYTGRATVESGDFSEPLEGNIVESKSTQRKRAAGRKSDKP